MNVGSILNEDSPPTNDKEDGKPIRPELASTHERHSIVNLLNDPSPFVGNKNDENHSLDEVNDEESDEDSEKIGEEQALKEEDITESTNVHSEQLNAKIKLDSSVTSSGSNEDELTKINKLKSTTKPKRYSTPPIWAQEWQPQGRKTPQFNGQIQNEMSTLSNKQVFDNTSTVSVDLECSITGVIPPPSVTRTIAEWIYANFNEIPDDKRKFVELELKFGTIIDKRQSHRININVLTECIYTDTSSIYFDMGVHEVGWNEMCRFLDDLEKQYQEDLRKTGNSIKPRRKFNTLESDITDTFYQLTNRNEQPKSIRVSKDNMLNPPRYTAINKQRISDLYIHIPSSMYDLRLSLSFEHPIPESNIDSIIKKNVPNLTRIKKRNTWAHRPTVTRFDMTRVLLPREFKNKQGKTIVEQDQSFEVELEVDTFELFNGFDKFKSGADSIRFEELVEIFVNNARCLNNRVTKLANK